jgi:hypothetical protein
VTSTTKFGRGIRHPSNASGQNRAFVAGVDPDRVFWAVTPPWIGTLRTGRNNSTKSVV